MSTRTRKRKRKEKKKEEVATHPFGLAPHLGHHATSTPPLPFAHCSDGGGKVTCPPFFMMVKMPANNRMHTGAALQTHGIWANTIGYDPYAPTSNPSSVVEAAAPETLPTAPGPYEKAQGLLALARLTSTGSANSRGTCTKCGGGTSTHLEGREGTAPHQCRWVPFIVLSCLQWDTSPSSAVTCSSSTLWTQTYPRRKATPPTTRPMMSPRVSRRSERAMERRGSPRAAVTALGKGKRPIGVGEGVPARGLAPPDARESTEAARGTIMTKNARSEEKRRRKRRRNGTRESTRSTRSHDAISTAQTDA